MRKKTKKPKSETLIDLDFGRIKEIWCCECKNIVPAILVSGKKIYPHRPDLAELPFWECDTCKNYVGCHHKTLNRTKPLGNIPTKEIKNARKHIHAVIDPLWKNHEEPYRARGWIYRFIAEKIGIEHYHTAEIKTIEEARKVYSVASKIKTAEECR